MATIKETCRHCGAPYSPTGRPKCMGPECVRQREFKEPDGNIKKLSGYCVFCCFNNHPNAKRTKIDLGTGYLCYHCGRVGPVCTCCENSVLCRRCCPDYFGHKFCCPNKVIQFIQPPLAFAYPAGKADAEDGRGWANRDKALQILNNTLPITYFDPKGFTINDSRRFASVEIEIFDYNNAVKLNKALSKWNCAVVKDASMVREAGERGVIVARDKSFEINTTPACGNLLYDQLKEVSEGLDDSKSKITIDCGIHVHVDCRDYGYQELRKFIKTYYFIEEALFAAVHWTRDTNDFCKRCGEDYYNRVISSIIKPTTKELKAAIIKSVYGDKSLELRDGPYERYSQPNFWYERADHYGRAGGMRRNEKRYSAINLHSYFLRGSIESRVHHASTDFNEIYNWTKILVDLFDSVFLVPEARLDKMLEISPHEIEATMRLIDADEIKRPSLDVTKVAIGLSALQYLLPQETFSKLLDKVMMNCHHKIVSLKPILPCQLGTPEENMEVQMAKPPQAREARIFPAFGAIPDVVAAQDEVARLMQVMRDRERRRNRGNIN